MPYRQMTFLDTPAHTFSPASEHGNTHLHSLDGQPEDKYGQAHAHANRSQTRENARGSKTTDTFGRNGSGSSGSAILTQSLASRLKGLLGTGGSILYSETWKQKATPVGRLYWAHTASALRTQDNACTGWPSPTASATTGVGQQGRVGGKNIQTAVMSAFPTPTSRDWKDGECSTDIPTNGLLGREARLAAWPTPDGSAYEAVDMERLRQRRQKCKERTGNGNGFGLTLGQAAPLYAVGSPRVTPQARDYKGPQGDAFLNKSHDLPSQAGEYASSCHAQTGSGGRLNPAFAAWLMGFPSDWLMVAPTKKRRGRAS